MQGVESNLLTQQKILKKVLIITCEDGRQEENCIAVFSGEGREGSTTTLKTSSGFFEASTGDQHHANVRKGGKDLSVIQSPPTKGENPGPSSPVHRDTRHIQLLGEAFSCTTPERHVLHRPTFKEYQQELETFVPNVVYFHSEASTGELGPLLFKGTHDVSPTSLAATIRGRLPEMVVFGVTSASSYSDAARAAGVPFVVFWPSAVSAKLAHHFGTVLLSILQCQASGAWDAFHLAEASTRMYNRSAKAVVNIGKGPGPSRQNSLGSACGRPFQGPTLLGKPPPKPSIPVTPESGQGGIEKGAVPKVGVRQHAGSLPPDALVVSGSVKCRAAVALDMDRMDAGQEAGLADAMETVLAIEARGIRLVGHPVSVPPPAEAASVLAQSPLTITMRCDICTTNGSRVAVVVAAMKDVFADEKILQQSIRRSLLEAKHVQPVFSKEGSCWRPPVSEAVGFGIDNVEGHLFIADWGRNVLYQLAHQRNFRLFGVAGIVQIQGYGVDGFTREDFRYYRTFGTVSDVSAPDTPPLTAPTPLDWRTWVDCAPPPFARSPEEALARWVELHNRSNSGDEMGREGIGREDTNPATASHCPMVPKESGSEVKTEKYDCGGSPPFVRVSQRIAAARQAEGLWVVDGSSGGLLGQFAPPPAEWPPRPDVTPLEVRRAALRPIPVAFRRLPAGAVTLAPAIQPAPPPEGDVSEPGEGAGGVGEMVGGDDEEGPWSLSGGASRWNSEANTSGTPGHNHTPASVAGPHHSSGPPGAVVRPQPLPPILDVPPQAPHGCNRKPLDQCTEEDFMQDLVNFLVARGHGRLIPAGGVAAFPDCNLNGSKLDLYNLYREVVTRGGFHVGNGINWKGQIFSNMRNHTSGNKMTGVGNTLKKHYVQYLGEYERAHDDIVGEFCAVCHSAAAGDWILCNHCTRWFHYACDARPHLPSYKHFSCEDGPAYSCIDCSERNSGARARFDGGIAIPREQPESGSYSKAKVPNKRPRI